MSILLAVAIRDSAAGAFNRPFFVPTIGFAVRSFRDECNRSSPDNPIFNHPGDFELWSLGTYDESNGRMTPEEPCSIARASDMKE